MTKRHVSPVAAACQQQQCSNKTTRHISWALPLATLTEYATNSASTSGDRSVSMFSLSPMTPRCNPTLMPEMSSSIEDFMVWRRRHTRTRTEVTVPMEELEHKPPVDSVALAPVCKNALAEQDGWLSSPTHSVALTPTYKKASVDHDEADGGSSSVQDFKLLRRRRLQAWAPDNEKSAPLVGIACSHAVRDEADDGTLSADDFKLWRMRRAHQYSTLNQGMCS